MAIKYQETILKRLYARYKDPATPPNVKLALGEFLIRRRGDARLDDGSYVISNGSLYTYLQSIPDDDLARMQVALHAIRGRLGVREGLPRAQVNTLVTYLRSVISGIAALPSPSDDQKRVRALCERFLRTFLHEHEETDPAQAAIAGIDPDTATLADLQTIDSVFDALPSHEETHVAADELPPDPEEPTP